MSGLKIYFLNLKAKAIQKICVRRRRNKRDCPCRRAQKRRPAEACTAGIAEWALWHSRHSVSCQVFLRERSFDKQLFVLHCEPE